MSIKTHMNDAQWACGVRTYIIVGTRTVQE